jgi:hypothetical protein
MSDDNYSFQDRLEHVLELHCVDPTNAYVVERDIGNGTQYAVELYDSPDSSTQLFESYWYTESELDAYLSALSNLHTMQRKQSDN